MHFAPPLVREAASSRRATRRRIVATLAALGLAVACNADRLAGPSDVATLQPIPRSNSTTLGPTGIPIPATNTDYQGALGNTGTGLSVPLATSFLVRVTGSVAVSNNPQLQVCDPSFPPVAGFSVGPGGDAYYQLKVSASVRTPSGGESQLGFGVRDGGATLETDTLWATDNFELRVWRSGIQGSRNYGTCAAGLYSLDAGTQTISIEVLDGHELQIEPSAVVVRKGTPVTFTAKTRGATVSKPSWWLTLANPAEPVETSTCGHEGANPCTVTVNNNGRLRASQYLYGRMRSASATMRVYTSFTVSGDRSEAAPGQTVTFTPTLDGVDGIASRWVWRDSTGTAVADPCSSINAGKCAYAPTASGTMWAYTNSNDSASAPLTVRPATLTLVASKTTLVLGDSSRFTATANGPLTIRGWGFRPDTGGGTSATTGSSWGTCTPNSVECIMVVRSSGWTYVRGIVDAVELVDSVHVAVTIADSSNVCTSSMTSGVVSTLGLSPTRSLACQPEAEPQPGDDIGDEVQGFDCASPGAIDIGFFVPPASRFILATYEPPRGGPRAGEVDLASFCATDVCTRDANAIEGEAILNAAYGAGEWIYTQGGAQGGTEPVRNVSLKYGDCTDFSWAATLAALGPGWPHSWDQKLSTALFHSLDSASLRLRGYRRVSADSARAGDIVVRGGHAGIFVGIESGKVTGYANNGTPATPDKSNKDYRTGIYDFSTKNGYVPQFFRPLVVITCP